MSCRKPRNTPQRGSIKVQVGALSHHVVDFVYFFWSWGKKKRSGAFGSRGSNALAPPHAEQPLEVGRVGPVSFLDRRSTMVVHLCVERATSGLMLCVVFECSLALRSPFFSSHSPDESNEYIEARAVTDGAPLALAPARWGGGRSRAVIKSGNGSALLFLRRRACPFRQTSHTKADAPR